MILGLLVVIFGYLFALSMQAAIIFSFIVAPIILARSQNLGTFYYFIESMQFFSIETELLDMAENTNSEVANKLLYVMKCLKISVISSLLLLVLVVLVAGLTQK